MSKYLLGLAVALVAVALAAPAQAQHHGYQQTARGHYDYVPSQTQWHGSHRDYVPAHVDYHRTPTQQHGYGSQYPVQGGYSNGNYPNNGYYQPSYGSYAPAYRPNYYTPASPCR